MSQDDDKKIIAHIVQHPAVNWMSPLQLIDTGLRAVLSGLFGAYADRREMQAALGGESDIIKDDKFLDYSDLNELWIDYIADLGDGWDSTYSMAWLVSQPELTLSDTAFPLKRGQILIMGGDEVYPTPSKSAYAEKMVGPYQAALPYSHGNHPEMLVLPGNHDWYDGLTGFLRLFCQRRWIGGRKTVQHRSYFVARLPHGWWLWGVDIQLTSDIDAAQIKYFEHFANQLTSCDYVILCTPVPAWVKAGNPRESDKTRADAYASLQFLEKMITEKGANVKIMLSGDLHHYAHYQNADNQHKITSGGGGAFLLGTHELPEQLQINTPNQTTTMDLVSAYPSAKTSKKLLLKNLWFSKHNPAFSIFLAFLYLCCAWIWQSSSTYNRKIHADDAVPNSLMTHWSSLEFTFSNFYNHVIYEFWANIAHQPGTLIATTLPIIGLILFATGSHQASRFKQFVWGLLHGIAHIVLAIVLFWLIAKINVSMFDRIEAISQHFSSVNAWIDSGWQIILFSVLMFVLGLIAGGSLFGLYLIISNRLARMHNDEVFSALHIQDYKNFLRIHICDDRLSLYTIKVDKVCRDWTLNPNITVLSQKNRWPSIKEWQLKVTETDENPWFTPKQGHIKASLMEAFHIRHCCDASETYEGENHGCED